MKLVVRTLDLNKALYKVQGIADKRSMSPITSHVLLTADVSGHLSVLATDSEISASTTMQAHIEQSGSVLIHARHLYDIVKACPAEQLELDAGSDLALEIKTPQSRFRLVGLAPQDFPQKEIEISSQHTVLPAGKLAQMIDRTVFCVSLDEARPNLSGVCFEALQSRLFRLVATDGHRLGLVDASLEHNIGFEVGQHVVVPRKACLEMRRILVDYDANTPAYLDITPTSLTLSVGTTRLLTRLLDVRFPSYQRIIPQDASKNIKLPRSAFIDAIKRVALLSTHRGFLIRMELVEGKVTCIAEDPSMGLAQDSLSVDYQGEPVGIAFNAKYFLEALSLITEQGVVLSLSDDLSPVMLKPLEDHSFTAVIMPVRL